MDNTIIYVIVGIFVLMYIIDKKAIVKPTVEKLEEGPTKVLTFEEKKIKRRNEIYKDILQTVQDINPLKTYRVWTYIEIPNESKNIQLSYTKYSIPIYFRKCIDMMKQVIPELIILTPLNIKEYLPDFDIEMKKESILPLKFRTDFLFASILKEYGGLCISPGAIVYDVSSALSLLHKYDIVTFGSNPSILNSYNHIYFPNTYIIGSQKGSQIIKEYYRLLLLRKKDKFQFNLNNKSSEDILSQLLSEQKPTQYHFGTEYDGTYNSKHQMISLDKYMGTSDIDFLSKDKLMVISIPYDILLESTKYKWFMNLSEVQFLDSNLIVKRLLFKDI